LSHDTHLQRAASQSSRWAICAQTLNNCSGRQTASRRAAGDMETTTAHLQRQTGSTNCRRGRGDRWKYSKFTSTWLEQMKGNISFVLQNVLPHTFRPSDRHQVGLGQTDNGQIPDSPCLRPAFCTSRCARCLAAAHAGRRTLHDVGLRVSVLTPGSAAVAVMGSQHATLRAPFCRASPTIATAIATRTVRANTVSKCPDGVTRLTNRYVVWNSMGILNKAI
jgi:hypothetical protein